MLTFVCKFADIPIQINAIYEETKEFCKDYLCDESGYFVVETTKEDLETERLLANRNSVNERGHIINYSDQYLETLVIYRKIAERLLDYNTILFHGSCISYDNRGYLFTARSGVGKSTHTRLWKEMYRNRVLIVNDDKPLIRIKDNIVYAYGTPWDGKHHLSTNTKVRLKAICKLERAENNKITKIPISKMFTVTLQQVYLPTDKVSMTKALKIIDTVLHHVECYQLECNMEKEAAVVAFEGMK